MGFLNAMKNRPGGGGGGGSAVMSVAGCGSERAGGREIERGRQRGHYSCYAWTAVTTHVYEEGVFEQECPARVRLAELVMRPERAR